MLIIALFYNFIITAPRVMKKGLISPKFAKPNYKLTPIMWKNIQMKNPPLFDKNGVRSSLNF